MMCNEIQDLISVCFATILPKHCFIYIILIGWCWRSTFYFQYNNSLGKFDWCDKPVEPKIYSKICYNLHRFNVPLMLKAFEQRWKQPYKTLCSLIWNGQEETIPKIPIIFKKNSRKSLFSPNNTRLIDWFHRRLLHKQNRRRRKQETESIPEAINIL